MTCPKNLFIARENFRNKLCRLADWADGTYQITNVRDINVTSNSTFTIYLLNGENPVRVSYTDQIFSHEMDHYRYLEGSQFQEDIERISMYYYLFTVPNIRHMYLYNTHIVCVCLFAYIVSRMARQNDRQSFVDWLRLVLTVFRLSERNSDKLHVQLVSESHEYLHGEFNHLNVQSNFSSSFSKGLQ